jgi:hypothetical protein
MPDALIRCACASVYTFCFREPTNVDGDRRIVRVARVRVCTRQLFPRGFLREELRNERHKRTIL